MPIEKNKSYYSQIQSANQRIDAMVEQVVKGKVKSLNLPTLILQITRDFAVPSNVVTKRIDLHCNSDRSLHVKNDDLCINKAVA